MEAAPPPPPPLPPVDTGSIEVLHGFILGDVLGAGTFGKVLAATARDHCVALKLHDKSSVALNDAKVLHRVRAEARVLRRLEHPGIVQCYGCIETDSLVCVVLSREVGVSMADSIAQHGALTESQAAPVLLQLARALRHCHERKVSHRDVKLDNIIYDSETGRAALVDFGTALIQKTHGGRLDVRCGSVEYNAPEMLDPSSKGYHGPAIDAWALGVVAYLLLCAAFPFAKSRTKLARGLYDKDPLNAAGVSVAAQELIAQLLVVDPNSQMKVNRLSAAEACKDSWLRGYELAADTATNSGEPPKPSPELRAAATAEAAEAEAARRRDIEELVLAAKFAAGVQAAGGEDCVTAAGPGAASRVTGEGVILEDET